jgi:hypothetical protein
MMVVVPVDAEIDETQHIADENRRQRRECGEVMTGRNLQLQHQDRDQNREDAVAESFEAVLADAVCVHSVLGAAQ